MIYYQNIIIKVGKKDLLCLGLLFLLLVLKKYGMIIDDYIDLMKKQNGVCAICKREDESGKRLSVDHDHSCCAGVSSCGKCIRGLLCSRCNRTLGMVEDNVDYLNSMIEYLK
jgi:hypothetical protein